MPTIENLENSLDQISRNFVHRTSLGSHNGFNNIIELCNAVVQTQHILTSLDKDDSRHERLSEYWLRLFNDFTSYCEDWPLDRANKQALTTCTETFNSFEPLIGQRLPAFTQTQQTRILSIALRARQVTLQPVVTGIVDSMGSTLTL